jgi:hypothetical protein
MGAVTPSPSNAFQKCLQRFNSVISSAYRLVPNVFRFAPAAAQSFAIGSYYIVLSESMQTLESPVAPRVLSTASNPATAHRTQVAGSGKRRGSKSSSRLSEAAESSGNVNRFNSGLRDRSVSCCGTGAQLPQNLCSALLLRIGTKWVASRDSPSLRRSATTAVKIRSWSRAFRN